VATAAADARANVGDRPTPGFDWPRALAGLAGLVAVGMYSVQYFSRPPLLLDEARLSLDIAGSSWIGLTRPLGYDQSAPLLFLWAEKLVTLIGGVNEYSLRLLPFLASITVLPLLWLVGRRVIGPPGAAIALGIAAVSPLLLQYCRQVKPYSLDAVVALALVWWALDWLEAPGDPRAARRLTLAGVVAVWLSTPAIFVLAGVLLALAAAPGAQRPPRPVLAAAGAAALFSFAAAYLWIYRPAEENPYIRHFWEDSLLTLWRPGLLARAWQGTREVVWQTFFGGATEPGAPGTLQLAVDLGSAPFLFLLAFGMSRLARWAGAMRAALLYAPVAVAVAASLLGKYPLAGRTMLFSVPFLMLAAAAGGLGLVRSFPPARRPAVAGLTGVCLFGSPVLLDSWLARHRAFESIPEAARTYRERRAPGDAIYLFAEALPGWTFYTTDWRAPDTVRLARMARLASFGGPAFENAPPRSHAIHDEGDSLVYPLWGGHEVVGLSHGAQWRHGVGLTGAAPDTNWMTNEGRRIRAAADPAVWVLTLRSRGLGEGLRGATGLCPTDLLEGMDYTLARMVRPMTPGACGSPRVVRSAAEADW
jgi:hypothetical protein